MFRFCAPIFSHALSHFERELQYFCWFYVCWSFWIDVIVWIADKENCFWLLCWDKSYNFYSFLWVFTVNRVYYNTHWRCVDDETLSNIRELLPEFQLNADTKYSQKPFANIFRTLNRECNCNINNNKNRAIRVYLMWKHVDIVAIIPVQLWTGHTFTYPE